MFLEWPTQSPDLNSPVEGIEALSCQVAAKKPQGFKEFMKEKWTKIPPEVCANLVTN